MLDRQYPATPSALSGHWRYPCCNENWKRSNGVENAEDLLGDQGLVKELKVRLMERMLGAERTEHLGYEPDAKPANQQSNRRNGTSRKTLKGNDGALPIDVPRDRDGRFEPELIKKGQTRIDGMDDKIIGL